MSPALFIALMPGPTSLALENRMDGTRPFPPLLPSPFFAPTGVFIEHLIILWKTPLPLTDQAYPQSQEKSGF